MLCFHASCISDRRNYTLRLPTRSHCRRVVESISTVKITRNVCIYVNVPSQPLTLFHTFNDHRKFPSYLLTFAPNISCSSLRRNHACLQTFDVLPAGTSTSRFLLTNSIESERMSTTWPRPARSTCTVKQQGRPSRNCRHSISRRFIDTFIQRNGHFDRGHLDSRNQAHAQLQLDTSDTQQDRSTQGH